MPSILTLDLLCIRCPQAVKGMWSRYGKNIMRIRVRPRDQWSSSRNSLKRWQVWRIVREKQQRVIRTGNGRSGSYADRPKHS